jgi:hypothetical protein
MLFHPQLNRETRTGQSENRQPRKLHPAFWGREPGWINSGHLARKRDLLADEIRTVRVSAPDSSKLEPVIAAC